MPLTILVADDDFATRLSITDYLEITGYSVIAAENGKEALGLVDEFQPHLIVTDITMPEMDGYEFVRRVRDSSRFPLAAGDFFDGTHEHARTDSRLSDGVRQLSG